MYTIKGWELNKNIFDESICDNLMEEGLRLRNNWRNFSNWKGISCASKHSNFLNSFYREEMPKIARSYLGPNFYYFNDQIVIKQPRDTLIFESHYDNYFGPNKAGKIHTVNLAVILSDFTKENGGLSLKDKDTNLWNNIYPSKGDVLAINGNTYHKSGLNLSDKPRGLYACVFSERPIYLNGFYNEKFK